jgi:ATP-dependent DNA helicase DinG
MVRFDGAGMGTESRVRVRAHHLEPLAEEGSALAHVLSALESDLASTDDPPEDVLALARRAAELRNHVAFLLRVDDPSYVYFLELRGRGVFLRAAPIDVSDIIRELVLEEMKGTVLTSATLTVDGQGPPGDPRRHRAQTLVGVRLFAAGHPVLAAAYA